MKKPWVIVVIVIAVVIVIFLAVRPGRKEGAVGGPGLLETVGELSFAELEDDLANLGRLSQQELREFLGKVREKRVSWEGWVLRFEGATMLIDMHPPGTDDKAEVSLMLVEVEEIEVGQAEVTFAAGDKVQFGGVISRVSREGVLSVAGAARKE